MMKVREEREYVAPVEEKDQHTAQPEPRVDENEQLAQFLNDPNLQAVVKRDEPAIWEGTPCEGEVKTFELPSNWAEITRVTGEMFGGRKYRLLVTDPRNGTILAARQFKIPGPPKLENGIVLNEEQRAVERMYAQARESENENPLARAVIKKQELEAKIEEEKLQQEYDELKQRRAEGMGGPGIDARLSKLQADLDKTKVDAKLEALQRENQLLREQQQKALAIVPKPAGADPVLMLIEQAREDRKASAEQFRQLISQMQDDKMDAMAAKLDAIANQRNTSAPGANALRDQLSVIGEIGKMFGIKLNRGEDGEDEDEEPKELWERLVDKYAPRLFDLFESNKKSGQIMTKEQLTAEMKKIEDETVDNIKKRLPIDKKIAPAVPATAPASGVTAPPATAPATVPPAAPVMTVEDEKKHRAATVLAGLDRESELRPRVWEWTEFCWRMMPEEYLEKMCAAPDPIAMISVFDGLLLTEKLTELKNKFTANEKVMAWVGQGLRELQYWNEEIKKDPNFDPFEEEDEA